MWTLRFIGFIYFLSAAWCLIKKEEAIEYLGFELKTELANIEYLSVYGGIQFGIAVAMVASSFKECYVPAALFFSLVFSVALMAFRWGGIFYYSSVEGVLALAIVETLLVFGLLYAYRSNKQLEY